MTDDDATMTTTTTTEEAAPATKSALQDNIERRGTNAYYYAHSHKANGPAWDGKAEPKLLSKHKVQQGHLLSSSSSSFDYAQSNITTYAFLDDGPKVKLYIELEGIGDKCKDEDVTVDYTETSLCLKIQNYESPSSTTTPPLCLCFAKLSGAISAASFTLKSNRIIITLTKCKGDEEWHTINDKGAPDHEFV
jgi:hypothetical protein